MPEGFILVDPESQPESSPTPISFAAPTAQRAAWRVWALVLGAAVAWLLVWGRLQPFADWLTYEIIGLAPGSRLGESVAFFLYDVPKILMLLGGMIFLVTVVRSFFSAERTRQLLGGKREGVGNVLAAGLGVVTPFCSCSAVPLFIGFVETGIPLGVTFSFLIATPMVNEVALAMLFGLFGWQIAGLYMITGLAVAIVAGWFIGRIPDIEKGVEDFVWQIDVGEANIQASKPTWTERFEQALQKLADGLPKPRTIKKYGKIMERIGRLKQQVGRAAQHYLIEVSEDEDSGNATAITWKRQEKSGSQATHPGVYALRTNIEDWDEETLWRTYTLLTDLEAVFRSLKTELGLRPIYHQKTDRVSGHLFISLLAYHLVHTLRTTLKGEGIHASWTTLRRQLETQQRVTVTLLDRDGNTVHIRKSTRTEPHQKTLYDALGISATPGTSQKTVV